MAAPAAWRLGLRASGFFHQQRQGGVLLAPGFQFLPYGTGPRYDCHDPQAAFQTQAQCPATVPLTIRHDPADPLEAQGETLFNGYRRFRTIAPVAIAQAQTER